MSRGDQLSRQWKIIQYLQASRQAKAVSEIAEELNCHTRTVYRDLEALQAAGFPIYSYRTDGKNRWSLVDAVKTQVPIPFSLTELIALYFSRDMLKILQGTLFSDALESLFHKIRSTLSEETEAYLQRIDRSLKVSWKSYKAYGSQKDILEKISHAAADQRLILINYYTLSRRKHSERKVAPYRIWYFDGSFYLIGYCYLRKAVRIFALDRVMDVEVSTESFSQPDNFDADEFIKSGFGVFLGEPKKIRIWFNPEAAAYIRERIWHETQKLTENNDDSVVMEIQVPLTKEIKSWILSWGAQARILEPENLKVELKSEIVRLAELYGCSDREYYEGR